MVVMQRHFRASGTTLIELGFALAIVAILAAAAIPGFRVASRAAAVRAASYELMAALQQTRSTAIAENRPATLCLANSGGQCLRSASQAAHAWRSSVQAGAVSQPLAAGHMPPGVTLRATRVTLQFRPTGGGGATSTLTICDATRGAAGRQIVVSNTGRARFSDGAVCG